MSGAFLPAIYVAGFRAGADLSALTDTTKYIALQLEADGDVNTAAAGESDFIGFLQNKPDNQEPAIIAGPGGGSKAIAAGTITAGNFLKTDSSGHLLAIGPYETARAVAFALESAVDNDVFNVYVLEPCIVTGSSGKGVASAQFTVTLAQINAGLELLPAVAGKKVYLHTITVVPDGSFAAGTAIEVYDSTTETNFISFAQAQLTNNAVLAPGISGATLGTAMGEGGASGEGVKIGKSDATAFTTATALAVNLTFSYV